MENRPDQVQAAPAHRGIRPKFVIGGLVIVAALGFLIFSTTRSTAAFFLTVDELYAKGPAAQSRTVRVSGQVVGDSVDFDAGNVMLRFELAGEGNQTLPVVFNGPMPDQLRDQAEAIVEGKYDGSRLTATSVLLKCPSRYEEMGVSEEKVESIH